jgi:phage terminase Nu1 subunit (DNA packaging protein)
MKYICSTKELAEALAIGDRRVQQLVNQGMPRAGHGRYDLLMCLRWCYLELTKAQANKPKEKMEGLPMERERLTRAQADREELELSKARGDLIPMQVYRDRMASHIVTARIHLLSMPARVVPALEGRNRRQMEDRLIDEVHTVLRSLANDAAGPGVSDDAAGGNPDAPGRARSGTPPAVGTASGHHDQRVGGKKQNPAKRNKRNPGPVRS